MRASYSSVSCWNTCPFLYKLRYIEHLETIEDTSPTNALYIGTRCHEGIEHRDVNMAINSYTSHFTELTRDHEIEILKLQTILPKAFERIPEGEYEYKLDVPDEFVGYIDCLVKVEDGVYDLLDFKTTNNISGYKKSPQVMIYKYYYERLTGNKIRDLYYVFIPKSTIKLTEGLSDEDIKTQIVEDLSNKEIHFEKVEYDPQQVNYFFARKKLIEKSKTFEKRYSVSCRWCDFQKFCRTNGADKSELKESSLHRLEKSL